MTASYDWTNVTGAITCVVIAFTFWGVCAVVIDKTYSARKHTNNKPGGTKQ